MAYDSTLCPALLIVFIPGQVTSTLIFRVIGKQRLKKLKMFELG